MGIGPAVFPKRLMEERGLERGAWGRCPHGTAQAVRGSTRGRGWVWRVALRLSLRLGRIRHSSSPLPGAWPAAGAALQMESSRLCPAALGGLRIPLGEGQVGSSEGGSDYRLSRIAPGCQSLPRPLGMSWRGAGAVTPPPPAAALLGRQLGSSRSPWCGSNAMRPSVVPAVPQAPYPPCHHTVLSHHSKCPGREGFFIYYYFYYC